LSVLAATPSSTSVGVVLTLPPEDSQTTVDTGTTTALSSVVALPLSSVLASTPLAPIIGGAVTGTVVLGILVTLCIYFVLRRSKRNVPSASDMYEPTHEQEATASPDGGTFNSVRPENESIYDVVVDVQASPLRQQYVAPGDLHQQHRQTSSANYESVQAPLA